MALNFEPVGLWWITTLVLSGLFVMFIVGLMLDARRIDGDPVWAKPSKFALSLAIHFATLAIVGTCTGGTSLQGPVARITARVVIASAAFEITYIAVQAARQPRSHFNLDTSTLRGLYAGMTLGAVLITVAAGWVGLALLIDGSHAPGPGSLLGAQLRLLGGTMQTLVTAFRIGGTFERYVGKASTAHARMPITGWSLEVGDRRIAHFFSTHMMQALPIAGLVADRLLPGPLVIVSILIASAVGVGLVILTYVTAERGKPFLL